MLSCHFCVAYGTESMSSMPRYVPGCSHCCCACCCVCCGVVISRSRFPLRTVKSRGEIGLVFMGSGAIVRHVFVFVGNALIGSAGLYHCGAGAALVFLPGLFPNTIQLPAMCLSGLGNLIPAA